MAFADDPSLFDAKLGAMGFTLEVSAVVVPTGAGGDGSDRGYDDNGAADDISEKDLESGTAESSSDPVLLIDGAKLEAVFDALAEVDDSKPAVEVDDGFKSGEPPKFREPAGSSRSEDLGAIARASGVNSSSWNLTE